MSAYLLFDVGGTSIKAACALGREQLLAGAEFVLPTRSNGTREEILQDFRTALEQAWHLAKAGGANALAGIGYAIGGPFDYEQGISLIRGVGKYEAIHGLSLKKEVLAWIQALPLTRNFRVVTQNDAAMFALGEARFGLARGVNRAMFVTLGTGAGSSFTINGQLITSGPEVPPEGFIYNTPFGGSILDDHISRRGLLRMAREAGLATQGDVKGLADQAMAGDFAARALFEDFGRLAASAFSIWTQRFVPDLLVIGGSIALAHSLFGPALQQALPGLPIAYSEDSARSAQQGLLSWLGQVCG